jgi:hypothetical protein
MVKIIFVIKIVEIPIQTDSAETDTLMKMNEKNVMIENKTESTDNVVSIVKMLRDQIVVTEK